MKVFHADIGKVVIKEVDVDSMNGKMVSINGTEFRAKTSYEGYFERQADAKQFIIDFYEQALSDLGERRQFAHEKLRLAQNILLDDAPGKQLNLL